MNRKTNRRHRAVIYWRVSRKGKRGGDSYITEEVQIETCRAAAKAKGLRVVGVFGDVNRSGRKGKMAKREQFAEALGMLERGEADVIIVARLSRFGRSVKEALTVLDTMSEWPTQPSLIAVDSDLDTGSISGKLLRTILLAVAEFEGDLAAERWEEARDIAAAKGIYMRKAPPGYRRNGERKLHVDNKVAPLVQALFRDRAAGVSWSELHRRWVADGGPPISYQGLQTIIRNEQYLGSKQPPVPALVSQEQWDDAQAVRAPRPPRKSSGSLLAGVVTCSISQLPMTSGGEDKRGRKSYRCQPSRCHGHRQTIAREHVDEYVEEELLRWAGERLEVTGTANGEHGLIAATAAREAAEAELRAYVLHTSAVDADVYEEGLAVRQATLDEARAEEARLRSERKVGSVRVRLAEVWPELDEDERRQLVMQAVEKVEVHPSDRSRGLGSYASEETRSQAVRERLSITFRSDAL